MSFRDLLPLRELHRRSSHGIQVALLWSEETGELYVTVADPRTDDAFTLTVGPGERPLDVFHHPYAYAALRGHVSSERAATDTIAA